MGARWAPGQLCRTPRLRVQSRVKALVPLAKGESPPVSSCFGKVLLLGRGRRSWGLRAICPPAMFLPSSAVPAARWQPPWTAPWYCRLRAVGDASFLRKQAPLAGLVAHGKKGGRRGSSELQQPERLLMLEDTHPSHHQSADAGAAALHRAAGRGRPRARGPRPSARICGEK